VAVTFSLLFAAATFAYFFAYLIVGIETSAIPQDIGKIKYVTSDGNDVFASSGAVVFNQPVNICDVWVENNVAHIVVSQYTIIRAPAFGIVTKAENGTIKINHGNSTESIIGGVSVFGVKAGEIVCGGDAIGSAENEITFSVSVSELPLNMIWLLEGLNESSSAVEK